MHGYVLHCIDWMTGILFINGFWDELVNYRRSAIRKYVLNLFETFGNLKISLAKWA